MRQFAAFVKKEFYHILRDRRSMLILLGMPVVMIVLFGFALSTEVRNINVGILASGHDNTVRQIVDRLDANQYFTFAGYLDSPADIESGFKASKFDMVVAFEDDFSGHLFHPEGAGIQFITDAANANMAQSYASYTAAVVSRYYQELVPESQAHGIVPNTILLFNPQMKSAYNFVPGIMGLILMLICAMMTAIAIVREKETGTMEVLLVSPIRPIYIIFAKMVPYFTLSCVNLTTILLLSIFVLGVPVAGGIAAVLGISLIYIFTTLAIGLLISTIARQQVVAMLISGMLLMVPTMLLSGMIFPVESMPAALRAISSLLPPTWYISALRKLMIEGLSLTYALRETAILCVMAAALVTISLKKFKNRLE